MAINIKIDLSTWLSTDMFCLLRVVSGKMCICDVLLIRPSAKVNKMNVKRAIRSLARSISKFEASQLQHMSLYSTWTSSKSHDWKKAVSEAEKIVGYPTSFMSLRCLLSDEMANVAVQIRKLVGTRHPLLKTARGFLFDNGKHSLQTRGLIVLLLSKCAGWNKAEEEDLEIVSGIHSNQRNLAEITEMIYTANLIHKGVVNLNTLEENDPTYKDMEYGNKIAILSGDFLLANASTGLAELNNTKVVEVISEAIGEMIEAEFTGLRDHNGNATLSESPTFDDWETQTYLQSGSLMSKSCAAALELAGHNEDMKDEAARFGKNVAFAKQMHEDLQSFVTSRIENNNLITTGPVIHYAEQNGTNSLSNKESNEIARLVKDSPSTQWCKEKCKQYGHNAQVALTHFPSSESKQALINIINATTNFSTL